MSVAPGAITDLGGRTAAQAAAAVGVVGRVAARNLYTTTRVALGGRDNAFADLNPVLGSSGYRWRAVPSLTSAHVGGRLGHGRRTGDVARSRATADVAWSRTSATGHDRMHASLPLRLRRSLSERRVSAEVIHLCNTLHLAKDMTHLCVTLQCARVLQRPPRRRPASARRLLLVAPLRDQPMRVCRNVYGI